MSEHDSETQEPNYARCLVYFAAERTLMSWVRTAPGLMALGFVIDRFGLILGKITPLVAEHNPRALSFWAGDLMVVAGAVMALGRSGDARDQFHYAVTGNKPPCLDGYRRNKQQQFLIRIQHTERQQQTENTA